MVSQLFMNSVARIYLDVGVHNGHQLGAKSKSRNDQDYHATTLLREDQTQLQSPPYLPLLGSQVFKHTEGLRKAGGVPSEVPLAISMFNVQPYDITGHVVIIKTLIHFQNISLIPVVPATLVVAEGEEWG